MALPPGPWKLPLIGSVHHMATGQPHRKLTSLAREHGPVMHLQLGEVDLIVVSSREAAREVMKTQDVNFAHRPELAVAKTFFYNSSDVGFSNGLLWRQLRKIGLMELLGPNRVRSFAPIRAEERRALLKDISEAPTGTTVDLSSGLLSLANNIVCRSTFGSKFKHRDMFMSLLKDDLDMVSGFSISDVFPSLRFLDVGMSIQLRRMHRDMDRILEDVLQERLQHERNEVKGEEKEEEDLIDVLLRARDQPNLEVTITKNIVKAVILDMFMAGTETTAKVVVSAMSELVRNPREMEKVQDEVRALMKRKGKTEVDEEDAAELSYLKLVIKETFRLHPPAPLLLPRECKEQCQLLGYMIPAGARVFVNAWALGRDPQYWDDADSFRPERFACGAPDYKGANFEFVPFGAGRRMCPGMGFGLANVEVSLTKLLFHFDWALPNGIQAPDNHDMTRTSGAAVVKKEPLQLVPTLVFPILKIL